MTLFHLLLISFFTCTSVFAGNTEEQRKYILNNPSDSFEAFINNGYLNGLSVKGHSTYVYYDIYLDTPDLQLYKNELSLRMRKRVYSSGEVEYGIQLKNEMIKSGQARMEVEEDDISFYRIYYNHTEFSLQDVLSEIFTEFESKITENEQTNISKNSYILDRVNILKSWLNFKIDSPIAPFQKLKKMDFKLVESLTPTIIGKSIRKRSHVFIDLEKTTTELSGHAPSIRSQLETPPLVKGPKNIWTMESSLDKANFYDLTSDCSKISIHEYEVENKFLPNQGSAKIIRLFEDGLLNKFDATTNLESKYRQSMNILSLCGR